ncbi:Sir2 histone deacetylase Hst2 [Malassezia sp. CBS 17886]|nr:Sir2 histone deacetylase Hst2 [Malassezia sp. CBS 17886]
MSEAGEDEAMDGIAEKMASGEISRILVMVGAGISTSAGIPDFRSPVTGLYAALAKYKLPYPEALFDIRFFRENPDPFYNLYQDMYPDGKRYRPTVTHCFLRLLAEKGKLLRVFSQNIDALEQVAGVPETKLVTAHGSFATARCVACKKEVDQTWLEQRVKAGEVARCQEDMHGGKGPPIKPDITFFGESLPEAFFMNLGDFGDADLLLVMGTSLAVQPFASLIDEVRASCPRMLFNLERVGESGGAAVYMDPFARGGFDFHRGSRDIFCQGRVDDLVLRFARKCGWEEELRAMHGALNHALDRAGADAGGSEAAGKTEAANAGEEGRERGAAAVVDRRLARNVTRDTGGSPAAEAAQTTHNTPGDERGRSGRSDGSPEATGTPLPPESTDALVDAFARASMRTPSPERPRKSKV